MKGNITATPEQSKLLGKWNDKYPLILSDDGLSFVSEPLGDHSRKDNHEPKRCYDLDGINDKVELLNSKVNFSYIHRTGVFSVSSWFKLDDYTADKLQIITSNSTGGGNKGLHIGYDNRSAALRTKAIVVIYYYGSGQNNYTAIDNVIIDNEWHNVTVTGGGDGINIKIYLDGVLIGTSSVAIVTEQIDYPYDFFIGVRDWTGSTLGFFDGKIFDVKFFTIELTLDQIQKVASGKFLESLKAHYRCDEGIGNISYDCSGNGNHGIIKNATLSTFHYQGSDVPYSWQNEYGFNDINEVVFDGTTPQWELQRNASGAITTSDGVNFQKVSGDVGCIVLPVNIKNQSEITLELTVTRWVAGGIEVRLYYEQPDVSLVDNHFVMLTPGNFVYTVDLLQTKKIYPINTSPNGDFYIVIYLSTTVDLDLRLEEVLIKSKNPRLPNSNNDINGDRCNKLGRVRQLLKINNVNVAQFSGDDFMDFGFIPNLLTDNFLAATFFKYTTASFPRVISYNFSRDAGIITSGWNVEMFSSQNKLRFWAYTGIGHSSEGFTLPVYAVGDVIALIVEKQGTSIKYHFRNITQNSEWEMGVDETTNIGSIVYESHGRSSLVGYRQDSGWTINNDQTIQVPYVGMFYYSEENLEKLKNFNPSTIDDLEIHFLPILQYGQGDKGYDIAHRGTTHFDGTFTYQLPVSFNPSSYGFTLRHLYFDFFIKALAINNTDHVYLTGGAGTDYIGITPDGKMFYDDGGFKRVFDGDYNLYDGKEHRIDMTVNIAAGVYSAISVDGKFISFNTVGGGGHSIIQYIGQRNAAGDNKLNGFLRDFMITADWLEDPNEIVVILPNNLNVGFHGTFVNHTNPNQWGKSDLFPDQLFKLSTYQHRYFDEESWFELNNSFTVYVDQGNYELLLSVWITFLDDGDFFMGDDIGYFNITPLGVLTKDSSNNSVPILFFNEPLSYGVEYKITMAVIGDDLYVSKVNDIQQSGSTTLNNNLIIDYIGKGGAFYSNAVVVSKIEFIDLIPDITRTITQEGNFYYEDGVEAGTKNWTSTGKSFMDRVPIQIEETYDTTGYVYRVNPLELNETHRNSFKLEPDHYQALPEIYSEDINQSDLYYFKTDDYKKIFLEKNPIILSVGNFNDVHDLRFSTIQIDNTAIYKLEFDLIATSSGHLIGNYDSNDFATINGSPDLLSSGLIRFRNSENIITPSDYNLLDGNRHLIKIIYDTAHSTDRVKAYVDDVLIYIGSNLYNPTLNVIGRRLSGSTSGFQGQISYLKYYKDDLLYNHYVIQGENITGDTVTDIVGWRDFNGVSGVTISSIAGGSSSIYHRYEFLVMTTSTSTMFLTGGAGSDNYISIRANGHLYKGEFEIYGEGNAINPNLPYTLNDGIAHKVIFTNQLSSTGAITYSLSVDGVKVQGGVNGVYNISAITEVARRNSSNTSPFIGSLRDFKIYQGTNFSTSTLKYTLPVLHTTWTNHTPPNQWTVSDEMNPYKNYNETLTKTNNTYNRITKYLGETT